jgi:two-component system invasion response regulator UvrY
MAMQAKTDMRLAQATIKPRRYTHELKHPLHTHRKKRKPMTQTSTSGTPIRVGVLEPHGISALAIRRMITQCDDMLWIATASGPGDICRALDTWRTDVLVMEIMQIGGLALDLIERLARSFPRLAIVIFTALPEALFALPLARLGARAYVLKSAPLEDLVRAIRRVAVGHRYFSGGVRRLLASEGAGRAALNSREFQVFLGLAAGHPLKAIARVMGLSAVTIANHRKKLLLKLGCTNNAQLVRQAFLHLNAGDL